MNVIMDSDALRRGLPLAEKFYVPSERVNNLFSYVVDGRLNAKLETLPLLA